MPVGGPGQHVIGMRIVHMPASRHFRRVRTPLEFHRIRAGLGAYLDQPEFQAFVDADAKRLIPVIKKIGRLDEKEK